jgi:hypothetical protein
VSCFLRCTERSDLHGDPVINRVTLMRFTPWLLRLDTSAPRGVPLARVPARCLACACALFACMPHRCSWSPCSLAHLAPCFWARPAPQLRAHRVTDYRATERRPAASLVVPRLLNFLVPIYPFFSPVPRRCCKKESKTHRRVRRGARRASPIIKPGAPGAQARGARAKEDRGQAAGVLSSAGR